MDKKIFVHTCCTACASHSFAQLKKAGFDVIAYFYNPEVDEGTEYQRRLESLRQYCLENKVKLVKEENNASDFVNSIRPYKEPSSLKYISDKERYKRKRCYLCNSIVIQKTIEQAKKHRIRHFSTTLLCSPYKNHDEIIEISNEKALDYNMNFYYQDFRKGYWMGRNYARNHGAYIPSYCGCLESAQERRLE